MHKVIPIQLAGTVQAAEKIHVRAVQGRFARWRWVFVWLTQILFYGLPWWVWHGRQAVLFDLEARRFFLFDAVLFPQDLIYLAGLLVVSALLLFFVTAVAGRMWCGFACPQSVYTSIFMWIETQLEGSAQNRKRLDASHWSGEKILRRGGKHLAWMTLSLWTGLTFVGYFTPVQALGADVLALTVGAWSGFWMMFYGVATYLNAGLVREKVCLHMCPYGRFQGSLMDDRTRHVAYDFTRGEPRGKHPSDLDENLTAQASGDCIDCTLCVQVCPTGIDIRQGLQAACIGCGLCIDACNQVMDKIRTPRGLIRLASLSELRGSGAAQTVWQKILRPRVVVYAALLSVCVGALTWAFLQRPQIRMNVMRDRSVMARWVEKGDVENIYRLQLMNASNRHQTVQIGVSSDLGAQLTEHGAFEMAPAQAMTFPITVRVANTMAAFYGGQIVHIRFNAFDPQHPQAHGVVEDSTFVMTK
ncbi:MAG: cytochrome c oxidase accessory protein CcoG [Limnohabitans sp.]